MAFPKTTFPRQFGTPFPPATVLSGGLYSISGTVYDSDGSTAVSGATVALGAYTADSGVDGTYTISGVPAGTSGSMTCTKTGYSWTAKTISSMSGNLTGQDYTNAWYAWGGISANVIAGYKPSGASSLADSYLRKVGSGGNATLDPATVGSGVAPTSWDALGGWYFDGSNDILFSGVVPSANFTVIVAIMDSGSDGGAFSVMGVNDGSNVILLYPAYGAIAGGAAGTVGGYYGGTTLDTQAPAKWRYHVFAYSTAGGAKKLYVDGSLFKTMTGGTMPGTYGITLGAGNASGAAYRWNRHWMQVFFAYDVGLDANQISKITAALQSNLAVPSNLRGAWTFFGSPHAVRFSGGSDKTYIASIGVSGNPMIAEYNHGTSTMSSPVALKTNFNTDDHANPNILVRLSDSKLMAFYCKHNDPAQMLFRVSTNAEDSSAWGAETNLHATLAKAPYTYPTPIQLDGEVDDPIYLFFRGYDTGVAGLYYTKSTDGGSTWAAPVLVFSNTSSYNPYWSICQNGTDRIDIAITDAHPNQLETNSIYHFYYTGGSWYKSDGTGITLPLAPADVTKVYDGTTTSAWNWDIAIDGSGNPVIMYATFPGDTFPTSAPDHRYNQARWNGSSWDTAEICTGGGAVYSGEPYYSGGMGVDHDNVNSVYVSREVSGQFEIFQYTSADSGATWSLADTITSGSSFPNIRPVVPRNSSSELKVVWMYGRYTSFTDYFTFLKSNPQY